MRGPRHPLQGRLRPHGVCRCAGRGGDGRGGVTAPSTVRLCHLCMTNFAACSPGCPHACHASALLPLPHAQTSGTSGTTSATSCRPGSRSTSRTRTSTCPLTCCCALPASSCGPWHSPTTVPQWGAACSARRQSMHWTARGRRQTPWKRSLGSASCRQRAVVQPPPLATNP